MSTLRDSLFHEILMARQRVYAVREPTPLERFDIGTKTEVWVKREDQPPIYAYKWRGAFNRMATLSEDVRARGVVCASAGNHAQGVALAARSLGCHATIFMPRPTPMMKRKAVALHGQEFADIELVGDTFDEAYRAAKSFAEEKNQAFIHPYDDLVTMGGQGTLADEVVMSGKGPFDVAYLQVGGGGMAASAACWLKHYMPGIRIVGVEGEGQASMKAAIEAGHPVTLPELDIFCDGTAVQKTGDLTLPLCQELIDEFITVSNQEVCNAIRLFWNGRRRIIEPAGAIGLAGLLQEKDQLLGKRVLAVTCGANMDFSQLAVIAAGAGLEGKTRYHLRFEIPEKSGSLLQLLIEIFGDENIVEFQYGKSNAHSAYPVIGIDATPAQLDSVIQRSNHANIKVEDITDAEDALFRVIPYDTRLFENELFLRYEFPERGGALHEFLSKIRGGANLCYFNYQYSGERVGRALIGLEFKTSAERDALLVLLDSDPTLQQRHQILSESAARRILGSA